MCCWYIMSITILLNIQCRPLQRVSDDNAVIYTDYLALSSQAGGGDYFRVLQGDLPGGTETAVISNAPWHPRMLGASHTSDQEATPVAESKIQHGMNEFTQVLKQQAVDLSNGGWSNHYTTAPVYFQKYQKMVTWEDSILSYS